MTSSRAEGSPGRTPRPEVCAQPLQKCSCVHGGGVPDALRLEAQERSVVAGHVRNDVRTGLIDPAGV